MKILNISSSLLLFTLTTTDAFALLCPEKSKAPLCPNSGSTLLDETYPTQAFVISNQPMISTKESRVMTQNFVNKVISSYEYKDIPQIIIPMGNPADFKVLIANIKNKLTQKKMPSEEIEKILAQITLGPAKSYTWQQDWFESFVDLKTGSPVIRQIDSYTGRVPNNYGEELSKNGGECSLKNGDNLIGGLVDFPFVPATKDDSFGSGEMGGNIEGAPGGFCMVGDNQGLKFTKQFCGDEKNIIQVNTSWLSVGHVDELFKIIPTHYNDGRPKECEFSLMAASPKKAMSLMSNFRSNNVPFYDLNDKDPEVDLDETRQSRSALNLGGNFLICNYMQGVMNSRPGKLQNMPESGKSVFLKLFFGSSAHAATWTSGATNLDELAKNCAKNLDQVSNFEMQEVMKMDKDFTEFNQAIEESIEADKAKIKTKILSRLPQCASYYNELDVPDLFYGSKAIKAADGKLSLKSPGTGDSFLPNPTNSVLMNKTVTFPDSGNKLFNNYVKDEVEKRKLKADFISSWDYAHVGHGNIHCSSHSIPHCKPQPTSGQK